VPACLFWLHFMVRQVDSPKVATRLQNIRTPACSSFGASSRSHATRNFALSERAADLRSFRVATASGGPSRAPLSVISTVYARTVDFIGGNLHRQDHFSAWRLPLFQHSAIILRQGLEKSYQSYAQVRCAGASYVIAGSAYHPAPQPVPAQSLDSATSLAAFQVKMRFDYLWRRLIMQRHSD